MATAGRHGYSGECDPARNAHLHFKPETFSVGVFSWIPKKSAAKRFGRGESKPEDLKRGKVKVRIRGLTNNPTAVYRKAKEVCDELDAGAYTGPKTINLARSA